MSDLRSIKRALISVYDKSYLEKLAGFLIERDVEIISTGKTSSYLAEHGIAARDIATLSQFPEILDGRVKTLHARVFASLLFDRSKDDHWRCVNELAIAPIDLVVVNLYPFARVAAEPECDDARLVEFIDIGGPSMLRAAAKNFASVTVLSHPDQYDDFMVNFRTHNGVRLQDRRKYARSVFSLTSAYDNCIAQTLALDADASLMLNLHNATSLRYGENPHQQATLFSLEDGSGIALATTRPRAGKEISYNNLLDANASITALRHLTDHRHDRNVGAVVVKHGIPCGAAIAATGHEAITKAIASDPKSAFGGILAVGANFDEACAHALGDGFFEVVIAPHFSDRALATLTSRKNLRILELETLLTADLPMSSYRGIIGGMLRQDFDTTHLHRDRFRLMTREVPSEDDMRALEFAFRVVKSVPSNGITIASADHLWGVGAGQPNRIQSVELAITGATARGFDVNAGALASDAFFPFDDGIKLAHQHGIRLIIQPGGSIKDKDVIEAANDRGMIMVFTHQRHFRH